MAAFQFAAPTDSSRDLHKKGQQLLAGSASGRYADTPQLVQAGLTVAAFLFVYVLLLASDPRHPTLFLAALAGFLAYNILAIICHDASHGSFAKSGWINRLSLSAGFCLVGVSGKLWGKRHIQKHHVIPNVDGSKIDADSTHLVRLNPFHRWHWWHCFQFLIAPFMYMFALSRTAWLEDFRFLGEALRGTTSSKKRVSFLFEFSLCKVVHLTLALGLPLAILDITTSQWLIGYFFFCATSSFMFVLVNIGTHSCDCAEYIQPDENGKIPHDWATHQVLTSVDWAPRNRLAILLTGGANSHTAHHLFPHAAHCHNAKLSLLAADFARETGLRHNVTSFPGMLLSHLRLLWKLSWKR